tara:strand:- start:13278 stop:15050 length:1773 start_codon:yes stop_codon:yes gene_type:complete
MTITVNYEKRKNTELFQSLEKMGFEKPQNYIPIYKNFFVLNDTNFSTVNLNHTHYIDKLQRSLSDNVHQCLIKSAVGKPHQDKVFFKFAPLLDPVKFMIGKYEINEKITTLPTHSSTSETCNSKILDTNNCSYVDGFFSYLSNQLLSSKRFVHGIRYYGSFLTIKKNFKLNVYDDLEYLVKSDFFVKNKDKLFTIDNYNDLFEDDSSRPDLPTIKIQDLPSDNLTLDIDCIEETDFGDVFIEEIDNSSLPNETLDSKEILTLTTNNLEEHNELVADTIDSNSLSIKENDDNSSIISQKLSDSSDENSEVSYTDEDESENTETSESDEGSSDDSSEESEEEIINAYFPEFPVQLICMEACSDTLDQLILDDKMSEKLWLSALMQIIMTLITYQKVFSFTHNDLHTNNVMYVSTKKKFVYYCFKGVHYKVPTYGKIFKIIDFGRAIYKHDGKIMCSDSFSPTGDAATQYNIEPYYNPKKPRLEPNYSFDLCRLACSIFDYLVDDLKEIKDLNKCDKITRIIVEWCIDDNGINVLYKNNGTDRYPDFKLYKMIARCVHNHTPQAQLDRPEFKKFETNRSEIPNVEPIMNIDEM